MAIKILHGADLHLDSLFKSFPAPDRARLKQMQMEIPERLLAVSKENCCNLWLLAGDIFDGEYTTQSVNALKSVFRECGVPVMISPGNHDYYGPGSPWYEEQWPSNVHIFSGDVSSVVLPELSCRVFGAGFQSMDCEPLLEKFSADRKYRYEVGVFHGDALNANSNYNPISHKAVRQCGLDYLALGHTHSADSFRAGKTLCAWPGCPMGRGWDERGEKGVLIVSLDETCSLEFAGLDFPGFISLNVNSADELNRILPAVPTEDYYRITLSGELTVPLTEIQNRFDYLEHLEWIDRRVSVGNPWDNLNQDSFRGVYFGILHDMLQENSDDADLIQLTAEISQKILSGVEVDLS